ncbi:MAG: hypothetical protein COB42_02330 [Sulfurimonas sp.]|nr:MAG: hypothetical protein COB42_02330 [Sulfurimonas sp.]
MFNLDKSMPTLTKNLFLDLNKIEEINNWNLVGGTALSIYLQHRTSEDLDFFLTHPFIDQKIIKNIDLIVSKLSDLKWDISSELNEENQRDYNIGGVRVTFHTTTDVKLDKDDSLNYDGGYINISDMGTIAAMKMYTVLRYRIKSRDFYDLYTLINDGHFNFNQIIDLTQKNYPESNFESILVENRLLKSKLDIDDEGLEALRLNEDVDFKYIRKYFKKLIMAKVKAESDALMSDIYSTLTDMRFGLDNSTLCIKLAQDGSHSKLDEYCSLGLNIYPNEKNLSKKTVFHYLLDKPELFKNILRTIDYIPENIPNMVKKTGNTKILEIIDYEKLLNRQLKNIHDEKKVTSFLAEKDIDEDLFMEDLKQKFKMLKTVSKGP